MHAHLASSRQHVRFPPPLRHIQTKSGLHDALSAHAALQPAAHKPRGICSRRQLHELNVAPYTNAIALRAPCSDMT